MRGLGLLLLGLLSSCITRALWSAPSPGPEPKLVGEAECELALASVPRSESLAFSVEAPPKPPKRMGIELGRGRTRLLLRNPYLLSFAGTDLLDGKTPLKPERVTVNFAQTRTKHGTRRDPALLRIEGKVPASFASRIEHCEDPEGRRTLEEVREPDLRVQLGHGIDALVALAAEPELGDVIAWCGVEGPGTDWRTALDLARARGSLAPLDPYRVVVRRWRGGAATCYRLRLDDVVLASSMSFAGSRYTWEGLWICSLELPEGPAETSVAIPARLRYREYKQEGSGDLWWRVLLTPAALAADYGIASLDHWLEENDDSAR